jgi:hypothetical protein
MVMTYIIVEKLTLFSWTFTLIEITSSALLNRDSCYKDKAQCEEDEKRAVQSSYW